MKKNEEIFEKKEKKEEGKAHTLAKCIVVYCLKNKRIKDRMQNFQIKKKE